MKNPITSETKMLLAEIGIILILLALIIYMVKSWLDAQDKEDKEDEAGVIELGNTTASYVDDYTLVGMVKKIPEKDRANVLIALKKLPIDVIGDLVYKADGMNDDEEQVYSAIARLKTQVAFGFFCDYFKTHYKISLFSYLHGFLDNSEVNRVYQIVSKFKLY